MTRYHWTLSDGIYRLRPEGGPPGSSVVSLWLEGDVWQWTVWRGYVGHAGSTWVPQSPVSISATSAQSRAIEHARQLGVIGERDEVIG